MDTTNPKVRSAGSLAKYKVRNPSGEKLGDIVDFMIDLDSGRIAYAVLSFGGVMGLGSKLFAIPWKAMTLDAEDHAFVLDTTKQALELAPGFDKDNWPDMSDPKWGTDIHTHYGITPYWQDTP
jgi:sporulation protein YlmC with PRC-barrel domain